MSRPPDTGGAISANALACCSSLRRLPTVHSGLRRLSTSSAGRQARSGAGRGCGRQPRHWSAPPESCQSRTSSSGSVASPERARGMSCTEVRWSAPGVLPGRCMRWSGRRPARRRSRRRPRGLPAPGAGAVPARSPADRYLLMLRPLSVEAPVQFAPGQSDTLAMTTRYEITAVAGLRVGVYRIMYAVEGHHHDRAHRPRRLNSVFAVRPQDHPHSPLSDLHRPASRRTRHGAGRAGSLRRAARGR